MSNDNQAPLSSNPTRLEKDPIGNGLNLIAGDDSTGDTIRSMSETEIGQTLKAMLEALRKENA
jgi:hypothetical protein